MGGRPMATEVTDAADVILRDGRTLRLRPPRNEDAEALLEFFRSLSERSLYMRFHGFRSVDDQIVKPLLEPNWQERGALLGTLADGEGEQVVAVANYVRLREPTTAEAAFAVADEHQRRGIGTRLLEQLAARAAHVGIERFVASVLADNREMLGVFAAAGFELARELEGGEVEVEFPIVSTDRYRERVAERDHTAVTASLRPFFEATSVAVVGASRRRGTVRRRGVSQPDRGRVRRAGFYPVNPTAEVVQSSARLPDREGNPWPRRPGGDRRSPRPPCWTSPSRCGRERRPLARRGDDQVRRGGTRKAESASGRLLQGCVGRPGWAHDRPELHRRRQHHQMSASTPRSARACRPGGSVAFASQSGALGLAAIQEAGQAPRSASPISSRWATRPTSRATTYYQVLGVRSRDGRHLAVPRVVSATHASYDGSHGVSASSKPIVAIKKRAFRPSTALRATAH